MSFLYVKVHYGPDMTFHTLNHKPQRLYGLQDRLQKLGFRVDLFQVPHINYCVMEICGHEVFRCNITNLKFSTYHERDVVCQRAIEAVVESSNKFQLARSHLWIWTLIDYHLFRKGQYAPKNYWPIDIELKPFVPCVDCSPCRNKNTKNKNKNKELAKL